MLSEKQHGGGLPQVRCLRLAACVGHAAMFASLVVQLTTDAPCHGAAAWGNWLAARALKEK